MTIKTNKTIRYYKELTDYYLGTQIAIDSECHMFIDFNKRKDTGRGNIVINNDGSFYWYFTVFTGSIKEQSIVDLNKTPIWFQEIYCKTAILSKKRRKTA